MRIHCLKLTSTLCFGALLALTACTPKDEPTSEESTSTQPNTETTDGQPTDGGTDTSAGSTTGGGVSESQTMGDDTTSGSTGPDTGVTTEPSCPDIEDQENNASCTDATGCGCKSGKCFVVPILGGFCGECLVDSDCTGGGCTVPNPIAQIGATCNMGEAGGGCMSDDVCSDPANGNCGTLLEVPGIISVATCGECAENADCLDPNLANCTPTYDVANFSGQYVCVGDNTVPNNDGCNLTDDGMGAPVGNSACESGFCGEAVVMGLLKLGICGECNSNADCNGGTCTDPVVDLDNGTLVGSVCM